MDDQDEMVESSILQLDDLQVQVLYLQSEVQDETVHSQQMQHVEVVVDDQDEVDE